MPNGGFFLPSMRLLGVGVHLGVDWSGIAATAVGFAIAERRHVGIGGRSFGRGFIGRADDFAIAFENLLGGYVGAVIIEGGIVEDGLDVFRDLGTLSV